MKTLVLCAAIALFSSTAARADDPAPAAATAQTSVATEEEAPEATDVIKSVVKVADDYKAGGALAACAAVIALLMQLSKVAFLRKLLDDRGLGWVRPVALLVLAGAGGVIAALQTGAAPGPAILAGVLAGVTGVGLREIGKLASPSEASRVSVHVDAVSAASSALRAKLEGEAQVAGDAAVADVKTKLAALDNMPERQRLEKLAAMASAPTTPVLVRG